MQEEMNVQTEIVGDLALLIEQMKQMNLPTILDTTMPKVAKRLSWGWTLTIWLAHILSQGDHRKLPVRDWVRGVQETLGLLTGQEIHDVDFTDDRLTQALTLLSYDERWNAIEKEWAKGLIRVYDLQNKTVHVDATTISGSREGGEGSLWQYGYSKDDPTLPQIKLMMATLGALPIALEVVPGNRADDPLYSPIIQRVIENIGDRGQLLFVGDCKMSALRTRAAIQRAGHTYLTPLALVGEVASSLPEWVQAAISQGSEKLSRVTIMDGEKEILIALGYEFTRMVESEGFRWSERVLIVQSRAHASKERASLAHRLDEATAALSALTPPRGPGRKQIHKEEDLHKAAAALLKKYDVTGLLDYQYEREVKTSLKCVGRGRSGPHREKQVVEDVRYQITAVIPNKEAIAERSAMCGWRAFATNASSLLLSFSDAVLEYRQEYLVERGFGRLKGHHLALAPMYVRRDDQVVGLPRLLTLAVGVLVCLETVVRERLRKQKESIAGLFLDSPRKRTAQPTAERLLRPFARITLTKISFLSHTSYHITPLGAVHQQIIELLGFPPDLYSRLACPTIPEAIDEAAFV